MVNQRTQGPRTRRPAGMAGDGREEMRWSVVEQTVRRGTSYKRFKVRRRPAATTLFCAEARPRPRRSMGPVPLTRTVCSTTPQRRSRQTGAAAGGAMFNRRDRGPRMRYPAGMAGDSREETGWSVVEQTVRRGTSLKRFKQRRCPAATTLFRAEARPRSRRSVEPVPWNRTICSTTPQRRSRQVGSAGCALLQFSTSGRIRRGPIRAGRR